MIFFELRQTFGMCALLIAGGAALGIGVNALSDNQISLFWVSKETRVQRTIEKFGGARNFSPTLVAELHEVLQAFRDERSLILDARAALQFSQGRIPGALNLSRSNFDSEYPLLRERIKNAVAVIVYCSNPACNEAGLVAEALRQLAGRDIKIFPGGFDAWLFAKLPEERSP